MPIRLKPTQEMLQGFLPKDLHLHELRLWDQLRSFSGDVTIDINVLSPTSEIVLHAYQLHQITAEVPNRHVTGIRNDPRTRRLHLALDQPLAIGPSSVRLSWLGRIGDEVGFYRTADLFCTQFQPIDARRAFPCFDEPRFKTTFDLVLVVEAGLVALSNMPVKHCSTQGLIDTVSFERTPRMNTYLLAWTIGKLAHIETKISRRVGHLPIRIYSTPDAIQHAEFALDVASQSLRLFTQMFRIEFPLPKLDLVAVDSMTDEAMENWGLCIFKSNVLLLEGDSALNPSDANRIAYIVAHELAHQWFGNLVTPSSWDELWLNEGFATWAGWYAVDKMFPRWEIWSLFVVDSMREGFELDSMESSHPVQVHVPIDLEVDSMFDDISYLKGAAVIRMLATYLGEETFLAGVAGYLTKNSYGSGTGIDLWHELAAGSGEPVAEMVRSWIHKAGFPVVEVTKCEGSILHVKQDDILENGSRWWIPLVIQTDRGVVKARLDQHQAVITLNAPPLKINQYSIGFYRTLYPASFAEKIRTRLRELSTSDRVGLLDDAAAMTYEEKYPISTLMALLGSFAQETNHTVWMCVLEILQNLRTTFATDHAVYSHLQTWSSRLTSTAFGAVDWRPSARDDYNRARLRPLILMEAGLNGETTVEAEALRQFELDKPESFDMLRVICSVSVSARGLSVVHKLIKRYEQARTTREKDIYVTAMGNLGSPEDAHETLRNAFYGKILATQDLFTLASSIASNPLTVEVFWEFLRDNFDHVVHRMGDATTTLERLLRDTLSNISTRVRAKEIRAFFKAKDTTGYRAAVDIVIESIEGNADFRQNALPDLKRYLIH